MDDVRAQDRGRDPRAPCRGREDAVHRPARGPGAAGADRADAVGGGSDRRPTTRITLFVAFNYGGRAEIVDAARTFTGGDEDEFRAHLYAPDMHDPDLIIRTSGEQRISNYLLWQAAYSELVFREELWPDFSREAFEQSLEEFAARKRRFGGRLMPAGRRSRRHQGARPRPALPPRPDEPTLARSCHRAEAEPERARARRRRGQSAGARAPATALTTAADLDSANVGPVAAARGFRDPGDRIIDLGGLAFALFMHRRSAGSACTSYIGCSCAGGRCRWSDFAALAGDGARRALRESSAT